MQNEILFEEHDGDLNAKRVSFVSGATLFAVVNSSGAALTGNVTLNPGPNHIGSVSIFGTISTTPGSITIFPGPNFIGLTTSVIGNTPNFIPTGNVTLNTSPNFIGLVTVVQSSSSRSITGNVTLSDPKTYIGSVSVSGSVGITGNVTLSDSKAFIGLTTAVIGNTPNVVNSAGANYIGLVTVDIGTNNNVAIKGNVTLSDSKAFIGLTTSVIGNTPAVTQSGTWNVGLSAGANFLGLATVVLGGGNLVSAATLYAVVNTSAAALTGNVTLNPSPNYIGLTTVDIGTNNAVAVRGNVTLTDSKGFIGLTTVVLGGGNLVSAATLYAVVNSGAASDPKIFIGLVTNIHGSNVTLNASSAHIGSVSVFGTISTTPGSITIFPGPNYIGLVTVDIGTNNSVAIKGNVTLSDSKAFIGLVTVVQSSTARTITGNVTLSDSKAFIGLVTVGGGTMVVDPSAGAIRGFDGSSNRAISTNTNGVLSANVSLSSSPFFIGLVTSVPAYKSLTTVFSGVFSATGNNTVFTPPSSQRFYLKNLHISSLGRSELEIRSGPTMIIPYTALATTSGFFEHWGEEGLPARAVNDAFVVNLNGAATISYSVHVRFDT